MNQHEKDTLILKFKEHVNNQEEPNTNLHLSISNTPLTTSELIKKIPQKKTNVAIEFNKFLDSEDYSLHLIMNEKRITHDSTMRRFIIDSIPSDLKKTRIENLEFKILFDGYEFLKKSFVIELYNILNKEAPFANINIIFKIPTTIKKKRKKHEHWEDEFNRITIDAINSIKNDSTTLLKNNTIRK